MNREAILANVRAEIRAEVAYAIELADAAEGAPRPVVQPIRDTPKPLEHSLREAVARIIDPNAFAYWPAVDLSKRLEKALSKADAILALPEALLGVSQSQPGCDAPDGAASGSDEPSAAGPSS